jgi:hypothetical protein
VFDVHTILAEAIERTSTRHPDRYYTQRSLGQELWLCADRYANNNEQFAFLRTLADTCYDPWLDERNIERFLVTIMNGEMS